MNPLDTPYYLKITPPPLNESITITVYIANFHKSNNLELIPKRRRNVDIISLYNIPPTLII